MGIKKNIQNIQKEIPKDITLIAVSKTKPLEDLLEAYEFGIRDFAENKVQELVFKEENFHKDVRWHFIGLLQTNKVKHLVNKVHLIHSLSSISLLLKIEKEFQKADKIANTLIQINIGKEESKSGILEEELLDFIDIVEKCKFVKVKGLMVIIPKGNDEINKCYFNKTKKIFDELKEKKYKNISMEILSMGMSNDYKAAIDEGSTLIRIGTGIFGTRNI
ncbi:YggS family pyridoxal phosphate-dependent enzyme [Clostridium gasigenes]|uniref:YggS family pyridoxal phosphate-dependent enzyme n=1 Tax=Clostridium gasigenes TaxID=94869 RepID=UPI001C0B9A8F|nr:YggS family pyridoxal phosphate-dependent enzyme [Clostridium gasigenes]MBU3102874.1 YggS family pyridoxal phosphate-dependent enzyme [Clostridium gasigenes]